jgi:3-methyladenine DNA glycosylase AlkD
MTTDEVLARLRSNANPKNVEGMSRFGINPKGTLGVSVAMLRKMAKGIGKDHALALGLWNSGVHEARILASMVDPPQEVTESQMEQWVRHFDSWDICDQVCSNLFGRTPFAYEKAADWTQRPEEFVRRAGFSLIAALTVHDKKAKDRAFERFLPMIIRQSADDRNLVKKAVNWALRQIGKRNAKLNKKCIQISRRLAGSDSKSSRWIGRDALRELRSAPVQARIRRKGLGSGTPI